MSNCNNKICRDSYFNYGSYLRSRGYDKEICNLVTAIENGDIPIGGLIPGPGGCGLTITGDLTVTQCSGSSAGGAAAGRAIIKGGSKGKYLGNTSPPQAGSTPVEMTDLGLQVYNGTHIMGPIVQRQSSGAGSYVKNTNTGVPSANRNTNMFEGDYHVFQGPDAGNTEVHVKGNIILDGSGITTVDTQAETLTLETALPFPGAPTEPDVMLRLFPAHVTSSTNTAANGKDLIDVWLDGSNNTATSGYNWRAQSGLGFAIDGKPINPQVDASYGGTGIPGHARALRGLTATSAPLNSLDISYAVDPLDLSSISVDAYGTIRIGEGPTYAGTTKAPGNLDLSGGDINFYVGDAATGLMGYIKNATTTGTVTDLSMGKGYFGDLSAGELRVLGNTVLGTSTTDTVIVHGDLSAQTLFADTSLSVLDHATIGRANSTSNNVALEVTQNGSASEALVVNGDASFNNGVAIGGALRVFGDASFNKDVHIMKDLIVKEDVSCGLHLYVGHEPGVGDAIIYHDLSAGFGSAAPALNRASLRVKAATGNHANVFIGDGTILPPTSSNTNLKINPVTGQIERSSSSLRYKNNIRDLELTDAKRLMNIRAKKFNMNGGSAIPRMGFIAEEFHDAGLQEFVVYDGESRPDGINYEEITAPLLEMVRDNLNRVILLEGELKEAKERIAALEKK